MEENINEVLGITPQESQTSENVVYENDVTVDNSVEKYLVTIAKLILICGIIATIICFFYLSFYRITSYGKIKHDEFNLAGFGTTIEVLVGTLISWAVLRVFANISITLKEINSKLK